MGRRCVTCAIARTLKSRAQSLRRDPTPAEKKLWFEFLRDLPQRFTRQKPLGRFIADFYCSSCALVIEVDGDSHYSDGGESYDAERSAALVRGSTRGPVRQWTSSSERRAWRGCRRP